MKQSEKQSRITLFVLCLLCASTGGYLSWKQRTQGTTNPFIKQSSLGVGDVVEFAETDSGTTSPMPEKTLTHHTFKSQPKKVAMYRSSKPVVPMAPVSTESQSYASVPTEIYNGVPVANLGIGVDASTQYVLPTLRLSFSLSDHLVLGAFGSYIRNLSGTEGQAYGGGIDVAYYFSDRAYRGFLVDGSLGFYHAEGRNAFRFSQANPVTVSSTLGFTGDLGSSLNLTVSVGAQYAANTQATGDIPFNGWLPLAKVGLGYSF